MKLVDNKYNFCLKICSRVFETYYIYYVISMLCDPYAGYAHWQGTWSIYRSFAANVLNNLIVRYQNLAKSLCCFPIS